MTLVVIIRPEPGCAATLAAARRLRLEAVGFPLFETAARSWRGPDPSQVEALLLGSANVLRHGSGGLARYARLPAYAVGAATAAAAAAAGFDVVAIGTDGLQPLLATLDPRHRRLLRLCGSERVALDAPAEVEIIECVVYESRARALPGELARLLTAQALAGAVILLHSAAAARHLAAECDRLGIARARLRLAALGGRIAAAAGPGWGEVAIAARAEDAALLALAGQLCQKSVQLLQAR